MRQRATFCVLFLVALLGSPHPARPQEQVPTGREVMQLAEELLYTLRDQTAIVELTVTLPNGAKHTNANRWFWKNFDGRDGVDSKAIFYTVFPPAARGEAFLIWDYAEKGRSDDLWLYLPDLRKTRRLTTRDRHEAFRGSDLTFEDMGQRQLDLEHHTVLREEPFDGLPAYVVESTPLEADSPYSRKLTWIAKGTWEIRQVEFFDRAGAPLKTQTVDWKVRDGLHLWMGTEVVSHQTGSRTVLKVTRLRINSGLDDGQFGLRALTRMP